MRISLDDIRAEGLCRDFVAGAESFPHLAQMAEAGEVAFVEPISLRLQLSWVGDLIEVDGQLQSKLRFSCGRCLCEYETSLTSGFNLTYARTLPQVEDEDEDVELSAEDLGMILLDGDEIDFHEVVQEQVLLALPLSPLCNEDCRGLCPHCGGDLNTTQCSCRGEEFGNKFSALKNLKLDQ